MATIAIQELMGVFFFVEFVFHHKFNIMSSLPGSHFLPLQFLQNCYIYPHCLLLTCNQVLYVEYCVLGHDYLAVPITFILIIKKISALLILFAHFSSIWIYCLSVMQRTAADQILRDLQNNPDMWLQVMHVLQNTKHLNTKFFALQV